MYEPGRRFNLDRVFDVRHFGAFSFDGLDKSLGASVSPFQVRFAFFEFEELFFCLAAGDFGLREAPYS